MSDNTPSAEDVREAYQSTGDGLDFKRRFNERGEEFDHFLAQHDADLIKSLLRERPATWEVRDAFELVGNGRDRRSHFERGAAFDAWLAEHDAALIESLAEDFSTVMHPYEGGVTAWLRAKAQERREQ